MFICFFSARYSLRKNRAHPWESAENPADFYRKMVEDNHQFKIIKCEFRTMNSYYNELDLEGRIKDKF